MVKRRYVKVESKGSGRGRSSGKRVNLDYLRNEYNGKRQHVICTPETDPIINGGFLEFDDDEVYLHNTALGKRARLGTGDVIGIIDKKGIPKWQTIC